MSILIKGMEMPKSCYYCPMTNDGFYLCKATNPYKELEDDCEECKPQWCPLVPIPPHGDLIDRNKLYEKTAEWEAQALHMVEVTMHDEDATDWKRWSTVLAERSAFKFDVAGAPTIIEAEGKDDG